MLVSKHLWFLALIFMAGVIIISNVAVTKPVFGPDHAWHGYFNYGQFTFPIAFLITDIVNRLLGAPRARQLAFLAFAIAIPASVLATKISGEVWILAGRIGLASGLAFLVGQLLDVSIFQRLRYQVWWLAPFVSSLLASLVDTWIFYAAAFAGSGDWWFVQAWIDYGVKVIVALAALLPFRLAIVRQIS